MKIADFGLAKLAEPGQTRITRTRMVMGTPNYMAPEQIENPSTVDHRAGIYSLGVVYYEVLTGELPLGRFKAPSEKASVDARLDPVVLRSLEKDPGDRYQEADEVKNDVTRVRTGAPAPAPAPASSEPSDLARACKVILILALIAFVLPVALPAPVGKFVQLVAGALLIATLALSVLTLGWLLWQRGRRRGMGTALTAPIVSLLALSTFSFLTVRSAPSARARIVAPPPPGDAEPLALHFKSEPLRGLWSSRLGIERPGSRWSGRPASRDRIAVCVGHGSFPLGSDSVEALSRMLAERLARLRPEPAGSR